MRIDIRMRRAAMSAGVAALICQAASADELHSPPALVAAQTSLSAWSGPPPQTGAPSGASRLSGLPPLQPGLWEYRRTQLASGGGTPKTTTFRKCSNPNAEFESKLAELRERGCIFTPFRQHANRYEATWRCDLGDGRVLAMHDVVTIVGPTGYHDESQAVIAHETVESSTSASRVSDCPSDGAARGASPTPAQQMPK